MVLKNGDWCGIMSIKSIRSIEYHKGNARETRRIQ